MALAFQSQQSNGTAAGVDITINKPASTASGDLLVAHLTVRDDTASYTSLDGFTSILETSGDGVTSRVAYKVATGSEGASFTFSTNANGTGDNKLACVMRFTGNRQSSVISASAGQTNASSTTITAPTVTPVEANSILVFLTATVAANSTSSYAIATSNPSWTEIVDGTQGTLGFSSAYATRPEITATGAGTATSSGAAANCGQLIVVSEMPTVSASDTVTASDTVFGNLTIYILDILTATDTITSAIARVWTKLARNIKTWTNQNRD